MTTVYIAGPMTGYPDHNFPAFDAAAETLRQRGYEVISPADNARKELKALGAGVVPPTAEELHLIFRHDVNCVFEVDALYMLAGWAHSKGARIEHDIAQYLGKPVVYAETLG